MILKALYDYYDRCGDDVAPLNMAYVNFYYAIVISENGDFLGLEKLGENGLSILTFRPEERTSSPVAHCMGDNGSYVLGLKDLKDEAKIEEEFKKNTKNHKAFVESINDTFENLPNNKYAKAIYLFYKKYDSEVRQAILEDSNWIDFSKCLHRNITFRIKGERKLAVEQTDIIDERIRSTENNNPEKVCLVTGKTGKPVDTTYNTFIVGGKSNGKLVSFQISSGYDSYGKEKGLNATISEEAEFKYTTALLKMLARDSRNKFMIGDRTFLFWASSNSEACKEAEMSLFDFLGFADIDKDNPNAKIEQVRKVFKSIYSGALKSTSEDKFYILGLAPNAARIAVVYWSETTLKDFACMITRHFDDMEIVDTRQNKRPYFGLKDMLGAVTLGGKHTDATPNLPDAVVKSIFQGLPYPQTLYASAIRRIRAEQEVAPYGNPCRIAIIKAYLNRLNNNNIKIKVMLDKENTNQGYLCGRLFAVLDKIQQDANHINSIQERYMNSASTTPATVFATILNLSSHHSEKLNEGARIFYEKLKQEIISKLPADGFPTHLDLQDQGRFFVGFFHQRQDLFTSKKDENITE